MKKILFAAIAVLISILCSCEKEGKPGSNTKVTFRKANISGADMLALAQGSAETKAEGDITIGPKALYTVSEDGKMVQVTFNVEVEGADGEVAEAIQTNLIISPNFVFPVGDGWLWLANCFYAFNGDWASYQEGPAKKAMTVIMDTFNNSYHEHHGAHFLLRKSDGALFQWTIEAGAPDGMDDGFKQPTFLNGWFHQLGNDLFVKVDGWGGMSSYAGKLFHLQDKGSTLDAVNALGDNIGCGGMWPGDGYLGMRFNYDGASLLGILAPPSYEPVLLSFENAEKDTYMLSIDKKLYLAVNVVNPRYYNDGKEQFQDGEEYNTDIYELNISGSSISVGNKICTVDHWMTMNSSESSFISSGETLCWWSGSIIYTFDPKAKTVTSRSLPEHYPGSQDEYVNGVAYAVDGTAGYWECDLSKDAAEYVTLDWSSAAEYQGKIVPGTLRLERFEAASLTLQFKASLTNGTKLEFYTSVVGAERGKIKTSIGGENNAGLVVTTMVRLN